MNFPILTLAQLSAHLRALRRVKGLSQKQLGALLGVGQTRIARIERNPAAISVQQLFKLLALLGVRLSLHEIAATRSRTGASSSSSAAW